MKQTIFIILSLAVLASCKPTNQLDRNLLEKELTKGFSDVLSNFLGSVIYPSVMTSLQGIAALAAQVTAGVAIDGIPALSGLFGKRSAQLSAEELKGFSDVLSNFLGSVIYPSVMTSLQGIAALAAQVTAGVAIDGIPALSGLFGKRSAELTEQEIAKGFSDILSNFLGSVIYPSVMTSLQGIAALAAQVTAGVAIDGIPALSGLLG